MQLLSGGELAQELGERCARSTRLCLAVAFWGKGAFDALKLDDPKRKTSARPDISIVCNLRMGSTNPSEIATLREKLGKDRVRQHDALHSKIYLLDDWGCVGSSNFSSNGLAMQGREISGWREANIAFKDGALYRDVEREFEDIWKESRKISKDDLEDAADAWSRRRRLLPVAPRKGKTLFEVLSREPENLADRRIYICAYKKLNSDAVEKEIAAQQSQSDFGKKLSGFDDWLELPTDCQLICFFIDGSCVKAEGLWERSAGLKDTKFNGLNIQWCTELSDIAGLTDVGPEGDWEPIVREIFEEGGILEFGAAARKCRSLLTP